MSNDLWYWLVCAIGTVVAYNAGYLVGTHNMARRIAESDRLAQRDLVTRLTLLRDQYKSDSMRASVTAILNRFIKEASSD